MTANPAERIPQYDFTLSLSLSQATQKLEEQLAEAEHMQAKQAKTIRELLGSLRHWKKLHDTDQQQIVRLQLQINDH